MEQSQAAQELAREQAREQVRQEVRQQVREVRDQVREGVRQAVRGQPQVIVEHAQPPLPPGVAVAPVAPVAPGAPVVFGQPGEQIITVRTPGNDFPSIPTQVVDISLAFFAMVAVCVVGGPLARAFGRRIERRPDTVVALPAETSAQLQRIEHSVEAMAIEVERISEAQRYLTRLQGEREPVAIPAAPRRG